MTPCRFLLVITCLLLTTWAAAQHNQLLLRKNGITKLRFREGSTITVITNKGMRYTGNIYLLQNDSIYFDGSGIKVSEVKTIFRRNRKDREVIPYPMDVFWYSNLGIPLMTAGLALSGEPLLSSFLFAASIVYVPLIGHNALRILRNRSKRYDIGGTYDLRLLDIYRPELVPNKR